MITAVLTILLAGVACHDSDSSASDSKLVRESTNIAGLSVTVGDSSGVRILETTDAVWNSEISGRQIADTPYLRIGSPDDTLALLSGVSGVAISSDGRIVIGNRGFNEVRAYADDGTFLWQQGRSGSGPGEYQRIAYLQSCGDRIMIVDSQARRVTMLGWDGSVLGMSSYGAARSGTSPQTVLCNRSGHFAQLDRELAAARVQAGPHIVAAIVSADSSVDGSGSIVYEVQGIDRYRTDHLDGPAEFGKSTFIALGDSLLHVAVGDKAEVLSFDLAGNLSRIARWPARPARLTPAIIREQGERYASLFPVERRPEHWRVWRETKFPDYMPVLDELVIAENGELWIRQYSLEADRISPKNWWVLSVEGVALGTVTTPPRFELRTVMEGSIAGVVRDSLGVEYVELRALVR